MYNQPQKSYIICWDCFHLHSDSHHLVINTVDPTPRFVTIIIKLLLKHKLLLHCWESFSSSFHKIDKMITKETRWSYQQASLCNWWLPNVHNNRSSQFHTSIKLSRFPLKRYITVCPAEHWEKSKCRSSSLKTKPIGCCFNSNVNQIVILPSQKLILQWIILNYVTE